MSSPSTSSIYRTCCVPSATGINHSRRNTVEETRQSSERVESSGRACGIPTGNFRWRKATRHQLQKSDSPLGISTETLRHDSLPLVSERYDRRLGGYCNESFLHGARDGSRNRSIYVRPCRRNRGSEI